MEKKKRIPIGVEKIDSSTFQLTKIATPILAKISEKFSYLPPGYKFLPKYRLLGIRGVKIRMVRADGTFPSGLFSEVVNFITHVLNKKVVVSDDIREHLLPLNDFFEGGLRDDIFSDYEIKGKPVILRDYQFDSLVSAFENRNCILNLSTGSGKCLGPDTLLNVKLPEHIVKKYIHLLGQET